MTRTKKIDNVVKYIVNRPDFDVTNLKLQKLLYYCQAVHLVLNNDIPLFTDKIEAWEYGPVVPSVYQKYKRCKGCITEKGSVQLASKDIEAIDITLDSYGSYSASQLISAVHAEKPWIEAFDKGRNTEITTRAMFDYYKTIYSFKDAD